MSTVQFPEYESCLLCGNGVDVKPDKDGYYYDGQDVKCLDDECPATGSIMADPERDVWIDWHDVILEDGEWIPNPEWVKTTNQYL